MNDVTRQKMLQAKALIQKGQYTEARDILEGVDHPTAAQWIAKINQRLQATELGDPFADAPAPQKRKPEQGTISYTDKVVIVLVLYFVLYVPGLIANILWHNEGKRLEQELNQKIPGVGALGLMRKLAFWALAIPVVLVLLIVIVSVLGTSIDISGVSTMP